MRIWLALLLAMSITATLASSAWSEWHTYSVTDGLSANYVYAILEDRSGNFWFGTWNGVSSYDGVSWRTYTAPDSPAGHNVFGILEDRFGNLWFATDRGASRYDGSNWRTYTVADGLGSNYVHAVMEDRSGNLWFGTFGWGIWAGGVSRYDGVSWRTYTTADGLASTNVDAILEDRSGNLWVGTYDSGVSRYDGASWKTFTSADGLAGNGVSAIWEDRSGNLWFGTSRGLSRYDGARWKTFTNADGLAGNGVEAIWEDRSGNLWFGTSSGLSRYDGASWQTYSIADGLARNYVHAIFGDRFGNLWFGTEGGGVSRYDGVSWLTYTTPEGLTRDVEEISEDHSGNLWFGTDGGGALKYDGVNWQTYTTADGLVGWQVYAIVEDHSGNLWFGTWAGVSRYDGVNWQTYTRADGLANNYVYAIAEDRAGNLWFGTTAGVSRYDGVGWRTYTTADGLAGNWVITISKDRSGNLWFGTAGGGVSRYDGTDWLSYTTADGLAGNSVSAIVEDRAGNLWFGTTAGVSRYDGVTWQRYTMADGLTSDRVTVVSEDHFGNLWFGTQDGGVSRYDGVNWGGYDVNDGLGTSTVRAILGDHSGNLWFGGWGGGVTRHEPDHIAPQAMIWPQLPGLSPGRTQAITFVGGFREIEGVSFSYSFDGSPWSEWSPISFWQGTNLADGEHVFEVKARDKIGNVDPTPAICGFEIDGTPPTPIITAPASGQAVRDSVVIRGTAADLRFKRYCIDIRPLGFAAWDSVTGSSSPATDGTLGTWNTLPLVDGNYEMRLSVTDTLGLTGTALVRVIVDNHAPWADQTSPATANAATGGDIYTTNEEVHLYFPPHAFARDTEVTITALAKSEVPDTLADGARRVFAGHEISWGGAVLEKAATLEMSYASPEMSLTASQCGDIQRSSKVSDEGEASPAPVTSWTGDIETSMSEGHSPQVDGTLALCVFGSDSTWQRLGGTVDTSAKRVSAPITGPGLFAVFADQAGVSGPGMLWALSVTPRVFSPGGRFANEEVAVGFTLGRPGPVTVKVYNRAGRLVREVASGQPMNAGANLVRWDGRDLDTNLVQGGLYLVVVEALGQKQTKTLAVAR